MNYPSRGRHIKKIIFLIVEVIIIAVLIYGGYMFSKLNNISQISLNGKKVKSNVTETTQKTFTGYTTIALFGLDNRKAGEYQSGNTDVIMIICINNDTKEMNLVSVYRDTFMNVSSSDDDSAAGTYFAKCNSGYARGGCEQAITMLNKNLDLNIGANDYISFDFKAVADCINILGGVDVNIASEEELGYLNKYIKHTNGILKTSSKTISTTGKHNLDGTQAVAYARIRYTKGMDFERAQRQRIVLNQMLKKVKNASVMQLSSILDKVFPEIQTGLSQQELLEMASVMLKYDLKSTRGFPFSKNLITLGGKGDVVVPCDLETNVTKLHKILYNDKNYTPSETVRSYNQQIINMTGYTAESGVNDMFSKNDDMKDLEKKGSADSR